MSKADLKAAMESLQVRKPLRIPSGAPTFAPPPVAAPLDRNPTMAGNPTPDQNPTEAGKPTSVGNVTPVAISTEGGQGTQAADPTQVETSTGVDIKTEAAKPTQVSDPTSVKNPAQVGESTPVGKPTEVTPALAARRSTEQDSSVVLDSRAADGLSKGYTRLPNEVLMRLASEDFTRNEIKLVLVIARFTISFQRKRAPLSKAVLERRTGLRGAAVLEALSGLVSKGIVEKDKGDQNRPNQLGLVVTEGWDGAPKPPSGTSDRTQVANPTQVENPSEVSKTTSVENSTGDANPASAGVAKPTGPGVGKSDLL